MAGTHFPEKGVAGESRLVWSGWLSACHEAPVSPSSGPENRREVPAAAFYPHRLSHLPPGLGMGEAVLLSQVECCETKVKTTKPCENLQKPTKEPENRSCRWSSKIPNFVLGQENIERERKGKSRVSTQCEEMGSSLTTQLSGSYFYGGKFSLKMSAVGGRGSERGQKRGELRDHTHNFFFFH